MFRAGNYQQLWDTGLITMISGAYATTAYEGNAIRYLNTGYAVAFAGIRNIDPHSATIQRGLDSLCIVMCTIAPGPIPFYGYLVAVQPFPQAIAFTDNTRCLRCVEIDPVIGMYAFREHAVQAPDESAATTIVNTVITQYPNHLVWS